MKIISSRHPWHFLVHPSTTEAGRWQLTRMEGDEPTGHTTWNTREEAVASACGTRVRGQIPVGDSSFRPVPILAPSPCNTCPYRKDTPPGLWAASEYQKLPDYDAGGMAFVPFHCHQENATGVPTFCRGWVSCHGFESIAIRLACSQGFLTAEQVEAPCPVELYASGREACDAGLAGVRRPSARARRAIDKLVARGAGRIDG